MGLMFGWDEKIECLQSVGVVGHDNEALCLAYKTSKLFLGAGIYLKDEGYVLGDPAQPTHFYPWPDQAQVTGWQTAGLIPDPLPAYSIPAVEYAVAYSLWIIVAVMAAWAVTRRVLTRWRQARDAVVPISHGPPKEETEGDKFIAQTVGAMLSPGERLQHQALAVRTGDESPHVYFAALTSHRLILISSTRKFRGFVFENQAVKDFARAQITNVTENAYELIITLTGGDRLLITVPQGERAFSNQRAFVRDAPRMLAAVKSLGPVVQVA